MRRTVFEFCMSLFIACINGSNIGEYYIVCFLLEFCMLHYVPIIWSYLSAWYFIGNRHSIFLKTLSLCRTRYSLPYDVHLYLIFSDFDKKILNQIPLQASCKHSTEIQDKSWNICWNICCIYNCVFIIIFSLHSYFPFMFLYSILPSMYVFDFVGDRFLFLQWVSLKHLCQVAPKVFEMESHSLPWCVVNLGFCLQLMAELLQ